MYMTPVLMLPFHNREGHKTIMFVHSVGGDIKLNYHSQSMRVKYFPIQDVFQKNMNRDLKLCILCTNNMEYISAS